VNSERFARISAAFDELIELDEPKRSLRLDEICGDDEEVRQEILAMLRADAQPNAPVDSPLGGWALAALGDAEQIRPIRGTMLGPWRVLDLIGEGGMGSVYLAERADGSFEQRVALKVLRRVVGAGSAAARVRFAQERQILADLQHAHIAGLVDGGVTEDGVPWFAMEHVDGLPITQWCRQHSASLSTRLQLVRDVTAAVSAAHQKLIIHRDLKPSNILVTADGGAKLLDFGIAKLMDPVGVDETLTGLRLMTPRYAAPEQILGRPVSTATDVYALGALLYELLAGEAPFAEITSTGRELEDAVISRDPKALPSSVALDLRRIVEMAMRREPERRYASAEAFANDLERFGGHAPVLARSATPAYRFSRYLRRHRAVVAALLAVFLALGAGLVSTAWQARRARQQAERAAAVSEFLVTIFDAGQARGHANIDLSARELLDEGRRQLALNPRLDPKLTGELLLMLGRLYSGLTQYVVADSLMREAEALIETSYGADSPELAKLLLARSEVLLEIGDLDAVDAIVQRVYELNLHRYGELHPETNATLVQMADVAGKRGDPQRSVAIYRQVLANDERMGSDDTDRALDLNNLGVALDAAGQSTESDSLLRMALDLRRRTLGSRHEDTAQTLHNLASTTASLGDDAMALELLSEAIEIRRELFPEGHMDQAGSLTNLAQIQMRLGEFDAARAALLEAVEMTRRLTPRPTYELGRALNSLGTLAYREGDYRSAADYIEQAIVAFDATIGAASSGALRSRNNRAVILHRAGSLEEAAAAFEDVMARRVESLGPEHPDVAWSLKGMGMLELDRGHPLEAEAQLREALRILLKAEPEQIGVHAECWLGLGRCALAASRLDEAKELLLEAETGLNQSYATGHPLRGQCREALAQLYERLGDGERAASYRQSEL